MSLFLYSLGSVLCGIAVCGVLSPAALPSFHGRVTDYGTHTYARSDTVVLSTITTDTGSFALGNKDFSRFIAPGLCLGAAGIESDAHRQSVAYQIARAFRQAEMANDTLPIEAIRVARVCAARFTLENTATDDLLDLFTLALMANQDSLAGAVVARRLALAPDVVTRATILQETVVGYLTAEPKRLTAAEGALVQLDAFGTPAQVARIRSHSALLEIAVMRFDEAWMHREAERIIALGQEVPVSTIQREKEKVWNAHEALGLIAWIERPDSVMMVVTRAKRDLARFGSLPNGIPVSASFLLGDIGQIPETSLRDIMLPFNVERYQGKPLPPVTAPYWFPQAPSSWPPGNGRAALVIYGGPIANACQRDDGLILGGSLFKGYGCLNLLTYVPHWIRQYGDRLSITLVTQSAGYAVRSLRLSPQAEADSTAWFFRDYLNLPVTVGIVQDSVWRLPGIDGRVLRKDISFYGNKIFGPAYWNYDSNEVWIFYSEHGKLEYVSAGNSPVLRKLIERTLGAKPLPGSSH